MAKKLSEMSLEELWELFPIFLIEHQEVWCDDYQKEVALIQKHFECKKVYINHIGSTAIKGIWAKPIIDILVEVSKGDRLSDYKEIISKCGYLIMNETNTRISFNKGYTDHGFADKVFHLHLRYENDNDELYFRDYLNDDFSIAQKYETLKLNLWKKYEHNRDGYTEAKSAFIIKHTNEAKKKYSNRYTR